jgi:hypothetical protein
VELKKKHLCLHHILFCRDCKLSSAIWNHPLLPPLCGSLGQFKLVWCTMENTGPAAWWKLCLPRLHRSRNYTAWPKWRSPVCDFSCRWGKKTATWKFMDGAKKNSASELKVGEKKFFLDFGNGRSAYEALYWLNSVQRIPTILISHSAHLTIKLKSYIINVEINCLII